MENEKDKKEGRVVDGQPASEQNEQQKQQKVNHLNAIKQLMGEYEKVVEAAQKNDKLKGEKGRQIIAFLAAIHLKLKSEHESVLGGVLSITSEQAWENLKTSAQKFHGIGMQNPVIREKGFADQMMKDMLRVGKANGIEVVFEQLNKSSKEMEELGEEGVVQEREQEQEEGVPASDKSVEGLEVKGDRKRDERVMAFLKANQTQSSSGMQCVEKLENKVPSAYVAMGEHGNYRFVHATGGKDFDFVVKDKETGKVVNRIRMDEPLTQKSMAEIEAFIGNVTNEIDAGKYEDGLARTSGRSYVGQPATSGSKNVGVKNETQILKQTEGTVHEKINRREALVNEKAERNEVLLRVANMTDAELQAEVKRIVEKKGRTAAEGDFLDIAEKRFDKINKQEKAAVDVKQGKVEQVDESMVSDSGRKPYWTEERSAQWEKDKNNNKSSGQSPQDVIKDLHALVIERDEWLDKSAKLWEDEKQWDLESLKVRLRDWNSTLDEDSRIFESIKNKYKNNDDFVYQVSILKGELSQVKSNGEAILKRIIGNREKGSVPKDNVGGKEGNGAPKTPKQVAGRVSEVAHKLADGIENGGVTQEQGQAYTKQSIGLIQHLGAELNKTLENKKNKDDEDVVVV